MKNEDYLQNENADGHSRINSVQFDVLNTVPASLVLLDPDGNILQVNDEWIKFGLENGIESDYPYSGKKFFDILKNIKGNTEEVRNQIAEGIGSILKGEKEIFSIDYHSNYPLQTRWFRTQIKSLSKKSDTGFLVMQTEISESKKTEEELKLLINNTEESFVLVNKDLRIVSFNNQFHNLYKRYLKLDVKAGDSIIDYAQPERKQIVTQIYKNGFICKSVKDLLSVPLALEAK